MKDIRNLVVFYWDLKP